MDDAAPHAPVVEHDVFSVSRARQVAAMLDQDGEGLRDGAAVPRGWHSAMFAPAVRPSQLRPDGFGGLNLPLPPSDLPRLMFGGRRIRFVGDIAIGAPARRVSRLLSATPKTGRSGRLTVLTIGRDIECAGRTVVEEQQDFVLREAAGSAEEPILATPDPTPGGVPFVADEAMLFRYCALTFNTHRIHYDHPYATGAEGYPGLVVNGNLTALMLTELFRASAGREPARVATRHVRPLFCRAPNRLHFAPGDPAWRLWAEDPAGHTALEAAIE